MHGFVEYFPASDIRASRLRNLLGGKKGEKGVADRRGNVQPCQFSLCPGHSFAGASHVHLRPAIAKVKRLPRSERARSAPPRAAVRRVREHGPRNRGQNRLGKKQPEDVVGGGAVRLPKQAARGKILSVCQPDPAMSGSNPLDRHTHRRIMLEREVHRAAQAELLGFLLAALGLDIWPGHEQRQPQPRHPLQKISGSVPHR